MLRSMRTARVALLVVLAFTALASSEVRKEFHYKVHHRASVSIFNQYGAISVKPVNGHQVVVIAVLHSDKVEVDQSQGGNRVAIASRLLPGANPESGRVDYEVWVPANASVVLHSDTGPIRAEKLHGDLLLEGNTADVDVRDLSDGHVHVKTLRGPVTLTNVTAGHVEITSISGDVALNSVSGPLVQVNSATGNILYDGDFGESGEYSLMTHTGNIDATTPAYASIDVYAHSEQGKVENDFLLEPSRTSLAARAGSAFAGTVGKAASSVRLLSFSGRIHLKKR